MSSLRLEALLAPGTLGRGIEAAVVLGVGLLIARLAAAGAGRLVQRRVNSQQALVARRVVFWLVLGLTVATVLRQLGVDLSVLLGAAGVLTVALGFAAQTSASNVISGLFLLGERPFVLGDTIEVNGRVGEVMSVDLLSVKLRTFDNLSVRVPNETLLKSEVINYTRHPIRRVDLVLTVAAAEELGRVRETLLAVTAAEPLCLEEPRAQFNVNAFAPAGVELLLSVWARGANVVAVATALHQAIHDAFRREGIALAAPAAVVAPTAARLRR